MLEPSPKRKKVKLDENKKNLEVGGKKNDSNSFVQFENVGFRTNGSFVVKVKPILPKVTPNYCHFLKRLCLFDSDSSFPPMIDEISVKMSSISGWTCSPLFKYNATFLLGDHHQSHHHMNYPSIFYSQSNNKLIFKLYDNAPRYHLPSPPCKRRQSQKRCLSSNITFLRSCLKPFCFRWFVWISARVTRIEPLMSQKNESASEISTKTKRTGIKLYRSQPLKISRWHPRQQRYLVTVDFCYPSWKRW